MDHGYESGMLSSLFQKFERRMTREFQLLSLSLIQRVGDCSDLLPLASVVLPCGYHDLYDFRYLVCM